MQRDRQRKNIVIGQQKGVLGVRWAAAGFLHTEGLGKHPASIAYTLTFPLCLEAQVSAAVREAVLLYQETQSTLSSLSHMLWWPNQRVKGKAWACNIVLPRLGMGHLLSPSSLLAFVLLLEDSLTMKG